MLERCLAGVTWPTLPLRELLIYKYFLHSIQVKPSSDNSQEDILREKYIPLKDKTRRCPNIKSSCNNERWRQHIIFLSRNSSIFSLDFLISRPDAWSLVQSETGFYAEMIWVRSWETLISFSPCSPTPDTCQHYYQSVVLFSLHVTQREAPWSSHNMTAHMDKLLGRLKKWVENNKTETVSWLISGESEGNYRVIYHLISSLQSHCNALALCDGCLESPHGGWGVWRGEFEWWKFDVIQINSLSHLTPSIVLHRNIFPPACLQPFVLPYINYLLKHKFSSVWL